MIAYLYAGKYSREVAGMVLVDPGSKYLKTSLRPGKWQKFVRKAKQLAKPKALEAVDYGRSVDEIRAAPPVPRVPAVVLTSDHPFNFGVGTRHTWRAWVAAQDRLAAHLHAKHITHTNSGHYIAGEQPRLVVGQVRAVVRAVRDQTP